MLQWYQHLKIHFLFRYSVFAYCFHTTMLTSILFLNHTSIGTQHNCSRNIINESTTGALIKFVSQKREYPFHCCWTRSIGENFFHYLRPSLQPVMTVGFSEVQNSHANRFMCMFFEGSHLFLNSLNTHSGWGWRQRNEVFNQWFPKGSKVSKILEHPTKPFCAVWAYTSSPLGVQPSFR